MHPLLPLAFSLVCFSVAGIAYSRKVYPLSLFAMCWAGYNGCLFITKVFP